jgi:steroid delta-isomerase-like uncharacterized protein
MSENNKAMARRFYEEVFNRRNLAAVDELCAAGIVDHNPLPGQPPGVQGMKDTLGAYFQAFPDLRLTLHEMVAEGDIVVARFTGQGTHRGTLLGVAPTGKNVKFTGIDMIRIKNGQATEVWHEGNDAVALGELGVHVPAST